jgi:hypothetical protein
MRIRRIFAGSIVALLLSVSPLAAACDLACAFARADSECHSQAAPGQSPAHAGAKTDGMAMAGMTMPKMPGAEDPQTESVAAHANGGHPSMGEMGACEKQPCNHGFAISARTRRSFDPRVPSIVANTKFPAADLAAVPLHDARDNLANDHPSDASPFQLSLRI